MSIVLTEIQADTIKELMNVGVNESTNILSQMLKVDIELTVPEVKILRPEDLMKELYNLGSSDLSAVNMEFRNHFSGLSQLVFSQESATKLVEVFSREVLMTDEFDEIKAGALVEIGNIILNAVLAEFSNFFGHEFEFFIPEYFENYHSDFYQNINNYVDDVVLVGKTLFVVEQYKISGDIVLYLNIKSFNYFISLVDDYLKRLMGGSIE